MTTDRPAAPARNTALAQSPSGARAASSTPAPGDTFSAMLGSVAPRPDQGQRQPARNDDGHRNDRSDRAASRPKDAAKPKAADDTKDVDPKDELEDEIKPKPGRLVTPELFALQLASPLAPAPAATPATATLQGMPGEAQAQPQPQLPAQPMLQGTPGLQGFAAQLPNAATQPQLPADAQATTTTPAGAQATPPAPAPAPPADGGIPLSLLNGLTPTPADALATAPMPQAQSTPATDVPATPQPDAPAFTVPNPADGQQQANTGGQPQNQPAPTPVPDATQAANKPAEQGPAPVVNATPVVTPVVAPPVPLNTVTGLQRFVPLSRVAETTATMIQIAADRGVTHARLNLKPVELGGIEVRLKTTPLGISAHLVADSPEAAKMLQSAAADLRRDLEARDVNLLSLDVSTSSEQQQNPQAQAGAFADEFGDSQTYGLGRRNRRNGDEGLTETTVPAETNLVLPNGVLVDVLA